jgi:hypothetical protein
VLPALAGQCLLPDTILGGSNCFEDINPDLGPRVFPKYHREYYLTSRRDLPVFCGSAFPHPPPSRLSGSELARFSEFASRGSISVYHESHEREELFASMSLQLSQLSIVHTDDADYDPKAPEAIQIAIVKKT